jgi:tetratricopeptide (TPR) repeat protein
VKALLLALLLAAAPALGQDAAPDEVDHVALAALLVRDGHWDRAADALAAVDVEDEGVDLPRYHLLRGLVALHGERYAEAASALQAAIDAGNEDVGLRIPLARALLGDGRPAEALAALDGTDALPGGWLVRARAHEAMDAPDAAFAALDAGATRFPDDADLALQRILLLVRVGLYQQARDDGMAWLSREDARVEASLAIAEALRQSGDTGRAIEMLEDANLRFPEDPQVLGQLAGTWLADGHALACAQVLMQAVELDPEYAPEAAECYRRAGDLPLALYMNGRVIDPVEKTRQRLGLLLEAGDVDLALSLVPRLSRLGLLDDDSVRYALAYASYSAGALDGAEAWLSGIADPEVFRVATQLRTALTACREEPWTCR